MNFNEYQKKAQATAIYPKAGYLTYCTLGLNGEAGEVAEKVKKIIRDKGGTCDLQDTDAIVKELGDVLWYLANLAGELKIDLNSIAQINLDKLASRADRKKLKGNGDDR